MQSRVLGLVGLCLLAPACARERPATQVTLGAIVDSTGTNADPSWAEAVRLAEDQMNAALGERTEAGLQRFDLILTDSANTPSVALAHATQLVKEKGAKALVVDSSENAEAINRMQYDFDSGNDLDVPLLCAGCTSSLVNNPTATDDDAIKQDALRNAKKWLFAGIMNNDLVALVLLRRFINETCNRGDCNADAILKIATYGPDDLEGRSISTAFRRYSTALQSAPLPIFENIFHAPQADTSSYDWSSDLQKLINAEDDTGGGSVAIPDLVSISTYAQYYVPVVRLFPNATTKIRFVQTDGFRASSVIYSLGSIVEEREGVSHIVYERDPSGEAFRQAFLDRTGLEPGYRAAQYYDNAILMMLAVISSSTTTDSLLDVRGEQVRDALRTLNDPQGEIIRTGPGELVRAIDLLREGRTLNYQGASGPMDFDGAQRVQNRLTSFVAKNGRFEDVATFNCLVSSNPENLGACPRED